jgi:hypothetical protein
VLSSTPLQETAAGTTTVLVPLMECRPSASCRLQQQHSAVVCCQLHSRQAATASRHSSVTELPTEPTRSGTTAAVMVQARPGHQLALLTERWAHQQQHHRQHFCLAGSYHPAGVLPPATTAASPLLTLQQPQPNPPALALPRAFSWCPMAKLGQ